MAEQRTTSTEGGHLVVALMFFTVLFALVGEDIKGNISPGQGSTSGISADITKGGRIIVGGFIATSLLVLATHAGEPGRQLGVGLAIVAFVTAAFVEGKPVWDAIDKVVGSGSTQPGAISTSPTAPSTPTTPGTNTVGSTATIATNLAG